MARGVDLDSQVTWAHAKGPAVSTSCPERLRPWSEGTWGYTDVLGHSYFGPRARWFDLLSRATRAWVRGPAGLTSCPMRLGPLSECLRCQPDVPSDSGLDLKVRIVYQHPRPLVLGSVGTRVQQAIPGDSGPGPRARRVDQPYQATRAHARGTVGSTTCPG